MTTAELGERATRGVVVTLVARWGNTATMLVSSVVLARLLTPHDFGIVAMVVAISGFAVLFQDLGLTSAAVRTQELTAGQQTTLFLANLGLGIALTVGVFCSAGTLAAFYGQPEVADVARALSATFVISSLGGQPRANLLRQLRFGVLASAQVAIGVLQLGTTVVLALCGLGYWALVVGNLAVSVTWAATLLATSGFRISKPAPMREVRSLLIQGAQITVIQAATFMSRNTDVVAVGRFHSPAATGEYNRASQVVGLVEQQLIAAIQSVALPVLSKLQEQHDRFQNAVERAMAALGHVLVPAFTSLSLCAGPAVALVYGSQWSAAGHVLAVLALAGTVRGLFVLVELAATALGQMKRQIVSAIGSQIITAAAVFTAAAISFDAVPVVYVASTIVSVALSTWWICRGTFVRLSGLALAFGRPFIVWVVAYAAALAVRDLTDFGSGWVGALLAIAVQFLVAAALIALNRGLRRDVSQMAGVLRRALRRRRER